MVRVAVAGNELTDAGLMLQLPVPYVLTQLRLTVPVNPSCDEIVIGPVVPVLPAFTLGKGAASVMTKVGLGTNVHRECCRQRRGCSCCISLQRDRVVGRAEWSFPPAWLRSPSR